MGGCRRVVMRMLKSGRDGQGAKGGSAERSVGEG